MGVLSAYVSFCDIVQRLTLIALSLIDNICQDCFQITWDLWEPGVWGSNWIWIMGLWVLSLWRIEWSAHRSWTSAGYKARWTNLKMDEILSWGAQFVSLELERSVWCIGSDVWAEVRRSVCALSKYFRNHWLKSKFWWFFREKYELQEGKNSLWEAQSNHMGCVEGVWGEDPDQQWLQGSGCRQWLSVIWDSLKLEPLVAVEPGHRCHRQQNELASPSTLKCHGKMNTRAVI